MCLNFFESRQPTVGSRESQGNTKEKVGLRQVDIFKFKWSN